MKINTRPLQLIAIKEEDREGVATLKKCIKFRLVNGTAKFSAADIFNTAIALCNVYRRCFDEIETL